MSCPECFKGHVHQGTPGGKIATIHGLQTYVATPKEGVTPKGIIVFIPDVFGLDFINNRILCDNYAEKGGFLVYLPDFMDGRSMDSGVLDLMAKITKPGSWLTALIYKPLWVFRAASIAIPWLIFNRASVCQPRIFSFFQALRTSPPPFPTPNLKVGAAGFCWGGKYTVLLAANSPSSRVVRHESQASSPALEALIDCGFTAHPSMLKMPKDIEEVTLPLSVAVGDEDMAMKGPLVRQMKEILEDKKKDDHEVVIMPGAKHGFAVRAEDRDDSVQMKWADEAEVQAIRWFTKWF